MRSTFPLVQCSELSKWFPVRSGILKKKTGEIKAVNNISFQIAEKEIVGVIGESGSGKSTLARLLVRLLEPTSGQILFDGTDITHMHQRELRSLRKQFQIVFQNPGDSLNSRYTIFETLQEVISFHEIAEDAQGYAERLMQKVGLDPKFLSHYPHELSIGQKQRVSIARALVTTPRLLVLDECVSSLDISVQAQVLNLLLELYEESHMSYLFISHDISVVEHLADKVLVMYKGEIVEQGPVVQVFDSPQHPYTKLLLSARFLSIH